MSIFSIFRGENSIYSADPSKITYPDVIRGWWAEALWHPLFLCVQTRSGFRGGDNYPDDKGAEIHLEPAASDEALGQAVLDAMAKSRWMLPRPTPGNIYHPDVVFDETYESGAKAGAREREWAKMMRKRYQLKYQRDLYVPMKRCLIDKKAGTITIRCRVHNPHRAHGNCWGYDSPENAPYVILPDTASAEEIGAGLRLGFSRCREVEG